MEYNSKFQAIQSANEVLTDPQQRAKYDAQRIRGGNLHSYINTTSSPSRPPVPTRPPAPGFSNFPPPPRPPPPPQSKSNFPPPPSGAQKYSNVRFNRPETTASWSNAKNDESRARANNDYKAWEQMRPRHGQGPIPNGRTAPPKAPRPSAFEPKRDPTTAAAAGSTARRSHWDRVQEGQAGIPSMARGNNGRASPSRSKFAPRTPGGDEPQAQGSAYFKVSRDERSAGSKSQNHMPPPPSPVPTAKKHDPLPSFKDLDGLGEPFGKKNSRASTYFKKGRGDGVNLAGQPGTGLHRSKTSAIPRDSNSRTGFYERNTGPSNHHSASPPGTKNTRLPGMYSSSSSSASSSDNERPERPAKVYTAPLNTRNAHPYNSEQPRRGFNLYANVGDERMAPQAGLGGYGQSGIRRHSAIDLNSEKTPEGFQEHRKKHEAERSQQQSTNDRATASSPAANISSPPLARSQSWQEKYGKDHRDKWGSPPRDNDIHSADGGQATKTPMYASQEYNPFSSPPSSGTPNSDKWSDQWPFKSPKKPKAATAEPPPYWAIPSSLPPPRETNSRKRANPHVPSRSKVHLPSFADHDPFYSFKMPDYRKTSPVVPPPLRSQSSDNIDTKFSPEGWHGKFFEPPPSHIPTPLRAVSPTEPSSTSQQEQATDQHAPLNSQTIADDSDTTPIRTAPPPPPTGQDKYDEKRWAPHINDISFDLSQSPRASSPVKQNGRKRVLARGPKITTTQATANDADDEPTIISATDENYESSKANTDTDAMDIDEPTPPRTDEAHVDGDTVSSTGQGINMPPPRRAPTLPPRRSGHNKAQSHLPPLNLADLQNTYPFVPSNEGLGNMKDIAGDLPFESKASPTRPVSEGSSSRANYPKPPVGPRHPQSLTDTSCDRFYRQVNSYLEEWYKFTVTMASELSSKRTQNKDISGFNLMDVYDEGYDDYMKGLEDSRKARVYFDVACEKHYKTMQDLGLWRQEMRRGRGGVLG